VDGSQDDASLGEPIDEPMDAAELEISGMRNKRSAAQKKRAKAGKPKVESSKMT